MLTKQLPMESKLERNLLNYWGRSKYSDLDRRDLLIRSGDIVEFPVGF